MTDAPFTETHALIRRLRQDAAQIMFELHPETYPGSVRDLLNQAADKIQHLHEELNNQNATTHALNLAAQLEAALAEIDRLTAELEVARLQIEVAHLIHPPPPKSA